ncbi:hypothetical protein CSC70_05040 [Pseudoxanthomonas kalamensis DSM 18571]|uniref:tetratricopeptide repeat-containing sulfotransferase family protein n=1 Tax=Pseudoxanthomonas kalamensis TaxID=289483 RepID=UPI001390DC3D|nr:tetratricopeptide repeat-containing sulfotransferase family protein [Pseudoxanthomonas kalamensis]KAF1711285.1 hypothetical protein CSC70_05040 [Pseudoxanthomonas kalamensis DSM 18571]
MQLTSAQAWSRAEAIARNHPEKALNAFESLLSCSDLKGMAHLRLGVIAARAGRMRDAVAHTLASASAQHPDPEFQLMLARQLADLGELQSALGCIEELGVLDGIDPSVLANAGKTLADFSFYDRAEEFLVRAARAGVRSAVIEYLIGLSRMYCGKIGMAQESLEACLRIDPGFAPAMRALVTSRRQTADNNHADRMRSLLARVGDQHAFAPLLHYSLFKTFDDMGDERTAWTHLEAGMRLRRAQISYDEPGQRALFDALEQFAPQQCDAASDVTGAVPIFIVGLPRSGSTLLERMLCTNPGVVDAGELRDFVCQLRWVCDSIGGPHLDVQLVDRAKECDWTELGRRYLEHTQWRAGSAGFYTDKLPANSMVAGYIAQALPMAKIVHIARDPMDACFSNMKALFADAYPYSYDQGEMARHFLWYRRLMSHWHEMFPGRILDIRYEELVAQPEVGMSRVLEFCGIRRAPGIDFATTRLDGMIGTASTVQVREPVHSGYVGQWQRYRAHLGRLQSQLGETEA